MAHPRPPDHTIAVPADHEAAVSAAAAQLAAAIMDAVRARKVPEPPAPDRLYSLATAATLLSVSRTFLYGEVATGRPAPSRPDAADSPPRRRSGSGWRTARPRRQSREPRCRVRDHGRLGGHPPGPQVPTGREGPSGPVRRGLHGVHGRACRVVEGGRAGHAGRRLAARVALRQRGVGRPAGLRSARHPGTHRGARLAQLVRTGLRTPRETAREAAAWGARRARPAAER